MSCGEDNDQEGSGTSSLNSPDHGLKTSCVKGGTHPKKRYWGRHFWARGYFCATVGQMTEEMVQEYLAHHFEPDRPDNFRTES